LSIFAIGISFAISKISDVRRRAGAKSVRGDSMKTTIGAGLTYGKDEQNNRYIPPMPFPHLCHSYDRDELAEVKLNLLDNLPSHGEEFFIHRSGDPMCKTRGWMILL